MDKVIVSAEWLYANFVDKKLVILDASLKANISGDVSEFENLQIKNARYFDIDNVFSDLSYNLPHMLAKPEQFEKEAKNLGINKDSVIVVYDNIGAYSSPRVYWMFKAMGHEDIFVLDGGLPNWVKSGYPTEKKCEQKFSIGDFSASYKSELVRNITDMFTNTKNNQELIIDARSKGRFNGIDPEPREWIQSGHIDGSKNLPFDEVFSEEKFKSKDELISLFKNLEINDKTLVFSCGSGLTACILLVAFDICGFKNKTAVYDGSWTEWAQSDYFIPK